MWICTELSWCNGELKFFSKSQVNGLVALMEGEHVGPFNLGNPGEFTMLDLAEVSLSSFLLLISFLLCFALQHVHFNFIHSLMYCLTYSILVVPLTVRAHFLGVEWDQSYFIMDILSLSSFHKHAGCQRNNWFKCYDRIQTKYCWWSTYEEARYQQSEGTAELGAKSPTERRVASYG